MRNYWTSLASQVEELDNPPPALNHLLSIRHTSPHQRVTFALPPHHVDKDSTAWRLGHPPEACASQNKMRMGVLNGTIPSAVSDTVATASAFLKEDPSIPTGRVSSMVFHLPNGAVAPATTVNKLLHKVRTPARDVNIVPSLVKNSLLSTSKFADAGYTAIYDENEVNFFDAKTTKIIVSADAVLKGWRCPSTKLWRVPLVPIVTNLNTDTIILDHPSGQNSLNSMYTVETNQISREQWHFKCARIITRSTSTTYTNSPVLNRPYDTSMVRRASQQEPPGSRLFAKEIISPGHSSM